MKSHQHQKAFNLYFQTDFTQKQIADMLNIDRKTLFTWAKEGNWKRAKHTIRHAPTLLAEQYYDQLAAINEEVAKREDRPYPTKEEAGIIKTLTATIKQIGKRHTLSETMEVFIDFELEVMRTDKDFARKMIFYMDKYIHTLASFDNDTYKKKYLWDRRNDEEYLDYLKEQEELSKQGEGGECTTVYFGDQTRQSSNERQQQEDINGEEMGSFFDQPDNTKPATGATNQDNTNINDPEKNIKGGIQERFQIPIKEIKNTPLIITNCTGHFLVGLHNMEGRMAFTISSDKPEESIDVSHLPRWQIHCHNIGR